VVTHALERQLLKMNPTLRELIFWMRQKMQSNKKKAKHPLPILLLINQCFHWHL